MKLLLCIIILASLSSCGGTAITKKLAGSDSLVITFNVANSDSVKSSVSTTDTKAIRKLAALLDGKKDEQYKCGYDGNMVFYSKGAVLMPVIFKYTEADCQHFLFDMDNKTMSSAMSAEAVSLLKSLAEGKSWY